MEDCITRLEHDEAMRRIDAEDKRQNRRIDLLEESVRQIGELTASVRELAVNMGNMAKEQEEQGNRLRKLENEPVDRIKSAKATAINTIVSMLAGALVTGVIVLVAQYI